MRARPRPMITPTLRDPAESDHHTGLTRGQQWSQECCRKVGLDNADCCWEAKYKEGGWPQASKPQSQWGGQKVMVEVWGGSGSSWREDTHYNPLSKFAVKGSRRDGRTLDGHYLSLLAHSIPLTLWPLCIPAHLLEHLNFNTSSPTPGPGIHWVAITMSSLTLLNLYHRPPPSLHPALSLSIVQAKLNSE